MAVHNGVCVFCPPQSLRRALVGQAAAGKLGECSRDRYRTGMMGTDCSCAYIKHRLLLSALVFESTALGSEDMKQECLECEER